MEETFKCPRCGNTDLNFVGFRNGQPYCRRCISFVGVEAKPFPSKPHDVFFSLHYPLSKDQEALSKRLVENYLSHVDTLVYAVCGAGKTELVFQVISFALSQGSQVGFSLPRKDVVIELYWRLKDAFPKERIVAVYGEHTNALEGNIVILTSHQLYRYPHYFDLLIMDEIDAFPFKGNPVLHAMFQASLRGRCIMMSATPGRETIDEFKKPGRDILELRTRFHGHPIPEPRFVLLPKPFKIAFIICQLRRYQRLRKPCFVFVPTIALSFELYQTLSRFVKNGDFVNSERQERNRIINAFRVQKLDYLVTTSVLERGVTVKNLQVLIFNADNDRIYDSSTLIQIAGRAGRKMDAPEGDVTFLGSRTSVEMEKAKDEIRYCNTYL